MQSQNQNSPLLVVVNSTGQQSRSVINAASAAGFRVRAQVRSVSTPEAKALQALPNVTLVEGSIDDDSFVNNTLFKDADYAWVNTTYKQGDEAKIGKALALAAKNAGVKHYLYSTLPDHSRITNGKWTFPGWAVKYAVEEYIRTLDNFPATFVYVGYYFENYDANQGMAVNVKRQEDGSILMSSVVAPHVKLGHLDVERDLGPAIVNILKQGPAKWNHKRIPLVFEVASLEELAKRFSDATGIKVTYHYTPKELDPANPLDHAIAVINDGMYFDWDCKVPDEGRELNPNWHSVEDFAKNQWKKPEA
jgi:uncharacterized protein YbjT (DUF2867 family)